VTASVPAQTAVAAGWTLRRANASDYDAVVRLQRTAFAPNGERLGVAPLPLRADYRVVLRDKDVWLATDAGHGEEQVVGVLVLERRDDDLMIESIATDPAAQGRGLGRAMLEFAEAEARVLNFSKLRLYTGVVFTDLVEWYGRHGFTIERHEVLSDLTLVHMMKPIA
jgi:ribosomal protein S18 acetylase RimI-like enzyme